MVRSPETLHTAVYQALIELPRANSERHPVGRVWNVPARSAQFTGRVQPVESRICSRSWAGHRRRAARP